MKKACEIDIKKLQKYPKELILEAISREWQADYYIQRILLYCERKTAEISFIEEEEAIKEISKTSAAYFAWKKEMIKLYGDGQSVLLVNVPPYEIEKGLALERAWREAIIREQQISKKIDKICKLRGDTK